MKEDDSYSLSFLFRVKELRVKSLEEQVVEIKNISKSSLKFTFDQGDCRN